MSYGAVQFWGIDPVVEAYENKRTPAFALWCGKQLQFRYDGTDSEGTDKVPTIEEGANLLRAYLSAIWQGSTALYTLKTYDDLAPGQKIRPSTEYDTAFNFKISGPVESMGGPGYPGRSSAFIDAINKINERLDQMEEPEEDPEPETLQEVAIGLIQEPEKLREVVEGVKGLVEVGRMLLGFPPPPAGAIMGAVTRSGEPPAITQQPSADKFQALEAALNTLERHDPALIDHLAKLAELAESSPVQFRALIGLLDKM